MRKRVKKAEWSKKFAGFMALALGVYGIWCGVKYY